MNKILLIVVFVIGGFMASAQKVDSIYFHLYTDSLKKGTHNYINVDGKLSNGRWQPMTSKDIKFSSSTCSFSGNDLVVPIDFAGDKITVVAELKSDPSQRIERTIWIKRIPDPEMLPTKEEILKNNSGKKRK